MTAPLSEAGLNGHQGRGCYDLLHTDGSGVRLNDGPDLKLFHLVGRDMSFLSAGVWFPFAPAFQ